MSKKKVLIVEDDSGIREALVELLLAENYQAKAVSNGVEALDHLEKDSQYDLILLDLMMPEMDGFTFRQEQIQNTKIANIPVVIMSADGKVNEKLQRTGCKEYMKKPFDLDTFLTLVSRIVGPQ